MISLSVIAGSTRPGRFNIQPATWIYNSLKKHEGIHASLLDLAEINLPLYNESTPPTMGTYEHEHTKKWSKLVQQTDGFIFVTPEYNHSYSAALKNALDYLYTEWNYKPVSFVSYGSLAGGNRAVEHLRTIAAELKMYDLREQVMLPNYWGGLDEKGTFQFTEHHEHTAESMITSLKFWAEVMKEARGKLS